MPSTKRSTNSARRPSTVDGSLRTRNVASNATTQYERGLADGCSAGQHDHERERDRDGFAVRRPQHDQLTGCDRAADECERRPTGPGLRELRVERHRRAPAEEDEDPGPPVHALAACSSGTRSPSPG